MKLTKKKNVRLDNGSEKRKIKKCVGSKKKTMFFCIALPNRRKRCEEFFAELGISVTYIDPVLKGSLDMDDLHRCGVVMRPDRWVRRTILPAGAHDHETACSLSHLKACKAFLRSGHDVGVVFEDDNVSTPDCRRRFAEMLEWGSANKDSFNVVNLSPCNSLYLSKKGILPGNQGCTNCLMYSRKGAEYVSQYLFPIRSPFDDWLDQFLPESYCLHERIFEQEDSRWPISWATLFNPVLRKQERLFTVHFVFVCIVAFAAIAAVVTGAVMLLRRYATVIRDVLSF
jgi:hypothetical protein